jgi:pyruvate,water dikinase
MLNMANPSAAFRWWRLPCDGVGLARMEFVINSAIKVHPMAMVHFDRLTDQAAKADIARMTKGHADKTGFFVDGLARGLSQIAAVVYPRPVIVRMSDFKTNEYADLLGGREFEPHEENPMIGLRGASHYYSPRYEEGFALECKAILRLRKEMGFDNVVVMIPFCRTPLEADRVLQVMEKHGLKRGVDGLEVYVMGAIPANVILAEDFARRFDGFSIGSNDLTQLTLGVDRDSEELAALFDESDPAVLWMIESLIARGHSAGAKVGLCGQARRRSRAVAGPAAGGTAGCAGMGTCQDFRLWTGMVGRIGCPICPRAKGLRYRTIFPTGCQRVVLPAWRLIRATCRIRFRRRWPAAHYPAARRSRAR